MASITSNFTVELPGWDEGETFSATLRRPSLLTMAATGSIPNELLGTAQRLFCEGYSESMPIAELGKLLLAVAREALVEPTFDSLNESGVGLTDMQLSAIYSFAQSGVRALEPFRRGGDAAVAAGDEQAVPKKAKRGAGRK